MNCILLEFSIRVSIVHLIGDGDTANEKNNTHTHIVDLSLATGVVYILIHLCGCYAII